MKSLSVFSAAVALLSGSVEAGRGERWGQPTEAPPQDLEAFANDGGEDASPEEQECAAQHTWMQHVFKSIRCGDDLANELKAKCAQRGGDFNGTPIGQTGCEHINRMCDRRGTSLRDLVYLPSIRVVERLEPWEPVQCKIINVASKRVEEDYELTKSSKEMHLNVMSVLEPIKEDPQGGPVMENIYAAAMNSAMDQDDKAFMQSNLKPLMDPMTSRALAQGRMAPNPQADEVAQYCLECMREMLGDIHQQAQTMSPQDMMGLGHRLQTLAGGLTCVGSDEYPSCMPAMFMNKGAQGQDFERVNGASRKSRGSCGFWGKWWKRPR